MFRAALRRANFKSVRGSFKFNTNHFPGQDFYIGQVVKSKKGLTHKIIGKPFTAQGDRYAKLCKM